MLDSEPCKEIISAERYKLWKLLLHSFAVVAKVLDICMGEYMNLWYIFNITRYHVPRQGLICECCVSVHFFIVLI